LRLEQVTSTELLPLREQGLPTQCQRFLAADSPRLSGESGDRVL
jgi:hypothetical protein